MKKTILIFAAILLFGFGGFSTYRWTVIKPDVIVTPNGPNTQVYWNAKFKTLILPHYAPGHLPVSQDSIGRVYVSTDPTDTHLYVYYGSGLWLPVANLSDVPTVTPVDTTSSGGLVSKTRLATNLTGYIKLNSGSSPNYQFLSGRFLFGVGPIIQYGATLNYLNSAGNASFALGAINVTGNQATNFDGSRSGTVALLTKRVQSFSSNLTTYSINTDGYDYVHITGQTATITNITTTGTPTDGDTFTLSITGTASVLFTLDVTKFEASNGVALSTSTSGASRMDMGFKWNTETSKWREIAVN